MAIKKSVRLVDETMTLCNELTSLNAPDINWSGSINKMAEWYQLLIEDCLPALTENEKNAFYCAYNGHMPHPKIQQELALFEWNIDQAYQYDSQVRDFIGSKKDAAKLLGKVSKWSISEKLAVLHMINRYWRNTNSSC